MSNWETDYEFMMANEDAGQAHAIVPDAPEGAYAISGINSAAYPDDFKAIAALPQSQRGPAVEAFYQAHEGGAWLAQIGPDEIAERILDAEVNCGFGTGVKLAQQAANTVMGGSAQIAEDGQWGPATVHALNVVDPAAWVTAERQARANRYKAIIAANPADARYETIWLARAME